VPPDAGHQPAAPRLKPTKQNHYGRADKRDGEEAKQPSEMRGSRLGAGAGERIGSSDMSRMGRMVPGNGRRGRPKRMRPFWPLGLRRPTSPGPFYLCGPPQLAAVKLTGPLGPVIFFSIYPRPRPRVTKLARSTCPRSADIPRHDLWPPQPRSQPHHRWPAGFPWNYDRDEIIADGVIVSLTFWLLAAGGLLYSMGVNHNAVWHAFVLVAAVCLYAVVLARV
jgi:hypothetical protein